MIQLNLQDLLAPTWDERIRTNDALHILRTYYPLEIKVWPAEIQVQISLLQPSPATFLSALIAFWADYSERAYIKRMPPFSQPLPHYSSQAWASPHLALFPMSPSVPPLSADFMRIINVWHFISCLGEYVEAIEHQLLACLHHPDPLASDAAERALGSIKKITDAAFTKLLAIADKQGTNERLPARASTIAKHLNDQRIVSLLQHFKPNIKTAKSMVRFAIIRQMDSSYATLAHQHLLSHIDDEWNHTQLAGMIRELTFLSSKIGLDPQALRVIKDLAQHNDEQVKSAAMLFLATHALEQQATLTESLSDCHPWLLMHLCHELTQHSSIPIIFLRKVIATSLGNYAGYDGEPHNSAVELITTMGQSAQTVLPEILAWWNNAVAEQYLGEHEINSAIEIAQTLGDAALPLLTGLEQALIKITNDNDQPNSLSDMHKYLENNMLAQGASHEIAKATAQFQYSALALFVNELDSALHLENEASNDHDNHEGEYPDEESELIIRLQDLIASLNNIKPGTANQSD